jgi:hypothetical protein
MGMDIELIQELRGLISEMKDFISRLTIEPDGSINTNVDGTVNVDTISIKDSLQEYRAIVDQFGRLLVNQRDNAQIMIVDSSNPNQKATVDSSGRLLVSTPPPQPPPNTTPIILTGFGAVSGNNDIEYTITNGKKLIIGRLLAGAEAMTKAGNITLYDNPDGNKVTLNLIAILYVNGSSDVADLTESFQGDGIRKIILRRTNLGGGSKEIFARFEGYEE